MEGIYVYIVPIHFVVQQKLIEHCKSTLPQLKKRERFKHAVKFENYIYQR